MARKNYPVEDLIIMVNGICADSAPESKDVRQGAINVLDAVLHRTGNYKGFRYLLQGECLGAPGVNYDGNGPLPEYELRFKDTDHTRVQY